MLKGVLEEFNNLSFPGKTEFFGSVVIIFFVLFLLSIMLIFIDKFIVNYFLNLFVF